MYLVTKLWSHFLANRVDRNWPVGHFGHTIQHCIGSRLASWTYYLKAGMSLKSSFHRSCSHLTLTWLATSLLSITSVRNHPSAKQCVLDLESNFNSHFMIDVWRVMPNINHEPQKVLFLFFILLSGWHFLGTDSIHKPTEEGVGWSLDEVSISCPHSPPIVRIGQ